MTVKTFYFVGLAATAIAPGWFGAIQDGSLPSGAGPNFGWKPGGAPSLGYFRSFLGGATNTYSQIVQASSRIDATTGPTRGSDAATNGGDSFITPVPLTGVFAAGNWVITFPMRIAGGGQNSSAGLLRFRVWASQNADGSSPRELTTSTLDTQLVTGITPTLQPTFTVTWAAPTITLAAEYLFFQVEPNITALAGISATWGISVSGTAAAPTVVTPDFQLPSAGGLTAMMA